MLEYVYDTLQAIIWNEFPKNNDGNPIIYDRPITKWYYGDRDLINETPSILFQGQAGSDKPIAQGIKEVEHTLKISCWDRSARTELSERFVLEFTRLVYETLLPHRIIWVFSPCPICLNRFISPLHFTYAHTGILTSYTTTAQNNFNSLWLESHFSGNTPPTWPESGIAVEAFNLLYSDVINNIGIGTTFLSPFQKNTFNNINTNKMRPIRLLYEVQFSQITPVQQMNGQELFRGGEFTITAKEIIRIPAFGPDNVPMTAWTGES